eukprot:CAMPEP_0179051334 /NCGR_PEP_ID=MMETSP0796-20121207/21192_1 /TAXON_ID=73915 /ORGANISM="Pyrodinium bahamense, Strain pbaha01" /LENGTH=544 /DNA_ID=CAMNT_0020747873 /DNA_START=71 /DNA_END=1705 /DNA_ORIENTATION=-
MSCVAARAYLREAWRVGRVIILGFLQNPWAVDWTFSERLAESGWFLRVLWRRPGTTALAMALAAWMLLSAARPRLWLLAVALLCEVGWRYLDFGSLGTACQSAAAGGTRGPRFRPLGPACRTQDAAGKVAEPLGEGGAAEQGAGGCREGWTEEQAALVEWIAQHTYRMGPDKVDGFWGMGMESKQLGFTSRRYHLAFTFYATVAAFQHVPASASEARRILDWLLEQVLDFRSWGYARIYWPEQLDPFDCDENVMWLGHVLAMVTLYEALLGDQRFRRSIAVRDDAGREFRSNTPMLAARVARAYRGSPRGGMCCEPGMVFFSCQNHALQGLYCEQQLSGTSFSDILDRWEGYAMQHFGAVAGGALQLCEVNCLDVALPTRIGHLGGDGWAVAYWAPWSPYLPGRVWHERVRPLLDPALPDLLQPLQGVQEHGPTTCTCLTLDIPRIPVVAFLFAAAAAIGDAEIADKLLAWLRSVARSKEGAMWIPEGRDWSVTSTAQLLFGLSLMRGATLRSVPCIAAGHQSTCESCTQSKSGKSDLVPKIAP